MEALQEISRVSKGKKTVWVIIGSIIFLSVADDVVFYLFFGSEKFSKTITRFILLLILTYYFYRGYSVAKWILSVLLVIGGLIGLLNGLKLLHTSLFGIHPLSMGIFFIFSGFFILLSRNIRAFLMYQKSRNTGSSQKPRTLLDEVQEIGGKIIINGYRRIAAFQGCAPTSKTTDKKIIEIYSKVGTAFQQAAKQRGELTPIPASNLNFIVWKFLQSYEMFGDEQIDSHLQYEIEKYLSEGLRPDYKQDLKLF